MWSFVGMVVFIGTNKAPGCPAGGGGIGTPPQKNMVGGRWGGGCENVQRIFEFFSVDIPDVGAKRRMFVKYFQNWIFLCRNPKKVQGQLNFVRFVFVYIYSPPFDPSCLEFISTSLHFYT